jgi:hypothetical protein
MMLAFEVLLHRVKPMFPGIDNTLPSRLAVGMDAL